MFPPSLWRPRRPLRLPPNNPLSSKAAVSFTAAFVYPARCALLRTPITRVSEVGIPKGLRSFGRRRHVSPSLTHCAAAEACLRLLLFARPAEIPRTHKRKLLRQRFIKGVPQGGPVTARPQIHDRKSGIWGFGEEYRKNAGSAGIFRYSPTERAHSAMTNICRYVPDPLRQAQGIHPYRRELKRTSEAEQACSSRSGPSELPRQFFQPRPASGAFAPTHSYRPAPVLLPLNEGQAHSLRLVHFLYGGGRTGTDGRNLCVAVR